MPGDSSCAVGVRKRAKKGDRRSKNVKIAGEEEGKEADSPLQGAKGFPGPAHEKPPCHRNPETDPMEEPLQKALEKARSYCAKKERCEAEIRERLKKEALPPADINRAVEALISEGFVDHARYARNFAADKLNLTQWGRNKIRKALREKGIGDPLIREAIAAIPEEEYRRTIRSLVLKRTNGRPPAGKAWEKIVRWLAGRGFEPEIVREEGEHLKKEE